MNEEQKEAIVVLMKMTVLSCVAEQLKTGKNMQESIRLAIETTYKTGLTGEEVRLALDALEKDIKDFGADVQFIDEAKIN